MIDYNIIYSDRRTMSLEVRRDGAVVVRAPKKAGKKEIEKFVAAHEKWLNNAILRQKERSGISPERTKEEIKLVKAEFKAKLMPLIEHYSVLMGVQPEAVTITSAKTRFGSCSGKNRLSFSYLLVDYPDEAIEYVVVHELAHIKHHNHSKEFYAFIEKFMPDYKKREKLLK